MVDLHLYKVNVVRAAVLFLLKGIFNMDFSVN